MPTIQFRTDDETKIASTALFSRLGITMSEAINLFLRQSVMRGGIPFSLTIPEKHEMPTDVLIDEALLDAVKRYRSINGEINFDLEKIEPFIKVVKTFAQGNNMRITLQEEAVKIRLAHKGKDYVLDYNFEEPDSVFVLSKRNDMLLVKDCSLNKISETLELF